MPRLYLRAASGRPPRSTCHLENSLQHGSPAYVCKELGEHRTKQGSRRDFAPTIGRVVIMRRCRAFLDACGYLAGHIENSLSGTGRMFRWFRGCAGSTAPRRGTSLEADQVSLERPEQLRGRATRDLAPSYSLMARDLQGKVRDTGAELAELSPKASSRSHGSLRGFLATPGCGRRAGSRHRQARGSRRAAPQAQARRRTVAGATLTPAARCPGRAPSHEHRRRRAALTVHRRRNCRNAVGATETALGGRSSATRRSRGNCPQDPPTEL